ncbi:c-type cytochrome [Chthonobacter albigriseus]|uniref:c-type cytochrome n=1 Tax=Chthonobacter albigriseus TaxID=1683161 RepID=UPI0015EE6542|nr:cytochrome c [Chthonobacter albigriseus]
MTMRHALVILAVSLLGTVPAAAQSAPTGAPDATVAGPTSPPPETPADAPTAAGSAAPTEGPSALQGKIYLQTTCSGCHAVGATDASTDPKAPAFREVVTRYQPEDLEESLAEGIVTGHPEMPQVTLDPPQIANVIAYLDALKVVTSP